MAHTKIERLGDNEAGTSKFADLMQKEDGAEKVMAE